MVVVSDQPLKRRSRRAAQELSLIVAAGGQTQREFKKAVETIHISVQKGRLTLITRKLFNVLICIAQEQKASNDGSTYSVPLARLRDDFGIDVSHVSYLKEQLKNMMTTVIEWDAFTGNKKVDWVAHAMVSWARITNNVLSYSFVDVHRNHLLSPDIYQKLDLLLMNKFLSMGALALYENTVRYRNNNGGNPKAPGLTISKPWQKWRELLSQYPVEKDDAYEFKYWKRDVLMPAIQQVNSVSDITLELIAKKSGKFITSLQFAVHKKVQAVLPLESFEEIDYELVSTLKRMGFSHETAQQLCVNYGEEKVIAAIAATNKRVASKRLAPVTSVDKYIEHLLRNDLIKPAAEDRTEEGQEEKPAAKSRSSESPLEKARQKMKLFRQQQEQEKFKALTAEEQGVLFAEFRREHAAKTKSIRKWSLESKTVATTFYDWLESRRPPPTADELLEFMAAYGLIGV